MPDKKIGRLEVITGCMFCGKTEELLRRLDQLQYAKQSYLLFKPSIDERYSREAVVTHYGREFGAALLEPLKENLTELISLTGKEALDEASVIAFDEGNFFSPKNIKLCEMLVERASG